MKEQFKTTIGHLGNALTLLPIGVPTILVMSAIIGIIVKLAVVCFSFGYNLLF